MSEFPFWCATAWRADPVTNHAGLWFRVCGYGLHISTKRSSQALFSERMGYRKALYVFGLRFEWLSRG